MRGVFKGRVVQHGDDLEISAELVDAKDDSHIWGEQYSRKAADIFAFARGPCEANDDCAPHALNG